MSSYQILLRGALTAIGCRCWLLGTRCGELVRSARREATRSTGNGNGFLKTGILAGVLVISRIAYGEVVYTEERSNLGLVETTVIRMSVTPAAEPKPALKHHLLIPDIDTQPGNAAPYYYRAMSESDPELTSRRQEFGEAFDRWYATGLEAIQLRDLPLDRVRKAELAREGSVMSQLRTAAARRECDWQLGIQDLRGIEVIAYTLPEAQESRNLSRLLALSTRLAVAERRYDDAVDTMRINYRIGFDVARVPLLVCGLVGIAEAGLTNGTLTELIAAPDSPNMYWALAELPQPLVDLRPAARFELGFAERMFPFIHNAATTERSPGEWNRLLIQTVRELASLGSGNGISVMAKNEAGAGVAATGTALLGYPHAKAWLIEHSMDREQVNAMSVGQVMAIYTERISQQLADSSEKLWYVPFWEMRELAEAADNQIRDAKLFGANRNREVLPIVWQLLPAIASARSAQVRLEREMAALQVIEALRMYAAAHKSKLPETLDAMTKVSVPNNPATGNVFEYRLDSEIAILELPKSDGCQNDSRRYEIQIIDNNQH